MNLSRVIVSPHHGPTHTRLHFKDRSAGAAQDYAYNSMYLNTTEGEGEASVSSSVSSTSRMTHAVSIWHGLTEGKRPLSAHTHRILAASYRRGGTLCVLASRCLPQAMNTSHTCHHRRDMKYSSRDMKKQRQAMPMPSVEDVDYLSSRFVSLTHSYVPSGLPFVLRHEFLRSLHFRLDLPGTISGTSRHGSETVSNGFIFSQLMP